MSDYVKNAELCKEMVKYLEKFNTAVNNKEVPPLIPNKIGIAIQQICQRYASKYNFNSYSYKDEMIADAVLHCINAVPKFNPEKSNNPFSFFTQCAFNSFVTRIKKEKGQADLKMLIINEHFDEIYDTGEDGKELNRDIVTENFE